MCALHPPRCAARCSYGIPWDFSSCSFDNFNGWADAADAALTARGVDVYRYTYRVYLLPPGPCNWPGQGVVGCTGDFECRSWIGGSVWGSPQVGWPPRVPLAGQEARVVGPAGPGRRAYICVCLCAW